MTVASYTKSARVRLRQINYKIANNNRFSSFFFTINQKFIISLAYIACILCLHNFFTMLLHERTCARKRDSQNCSNNKVHLKPNENYNIRQWRGI